MEILTYNQWYSNITNKLIIRKTLIESSRKERFFLESECFAGKLVGITFELAHEL